MSTRYSLPPRANQSDTDTARTARTLAAAVLALAVLAGTLTAVLLPPAEPAVAGAGEPESAPPVVSAPGA